MARSAGLYADTRRMRAAPLPRSLPLPNCQLPASPCRADAAKGAARRLLVTPYPARKEPAPVARLRPSNYPAKRCRVVSGRIRLIITTATKNQVNTSADTRFAVTASALQLPSSHGVPFPGAASLHAGFVHRLPRRSPPPALAGAVVRQGRAALRPSGAWHPRPSAPKGLPLCLWIAPDDRFAG